MRYFLGLCSVCGRFLPGFAKIAAPLNEKIKKGELSHFVLNDKQRRPVGKLKNCLASPPVLKLPPANGQYTVDTDNFGSQIGLVPLKEQDGDVLKPIGYWSRSICNVEPLYDTMIKKCLAIVCSVLILRPYLEASRFKIRTDQTAAEMDIGS